MELDIWSGDWGLPSVDMECLQVLTLLKTSGVAFKSNKTNKPFFTAYGLPEFKNEKKKLHHFHHILTDLKQKNYATDPDLSEKDLSDSLAYCKMIEQKLYPALRYIWWVDEKNYETVTRPWYAKVLPFPFNFFYPRYRRRQSESAIQSLFTHLEDDTDIQVEVFKEAEKCLTCLSNRLGANDFFFGSHPSAMDAFVYGCIAPLLKAPFPSNVLQNHVKACPNLVRFITRITQRYFSREMQEYEKIRPQGAEKPSKSDALPNKMRNQIFATVFAICAMLCYGISNGIFSISLNNGDSDDISGFEVEEPLSD